MIDIEPLHIGVIIW